MDETFEVDIRGATYGLNLVERQRALQNYACKTAILQELSTLGRHVTHLCRGVQLDGEVHLAIGHILHNEGIDTHRNKFAGKGLGTLQLALVEYGVEGNIDPDTEKMCIGHHTRYVVRRVCGGTARTKTIGTDI